jgi:hypothetical protein
MKPDDIVFDDDLEFYIDFPSTGEESMHRNIRWFRCVGRSFECFI